MLVAATHLAVWTHKVTPPGSLFSGLFLLSHPTGNASNYAETEQIIVMPDPSAKKRWVRTAASEARLSLRSHKTYFNFADLLLRANPWVYSFVVAAKRVHQIHAQAGYHWGRCTVDCRLV